jgi:hypothetical protein
MGSNRARHLKFLVADTKSNFLPCSDLGGKMQGTNGAVVIFSGCGGAIGLVGCYFLARMLLPQQAFGAAECAAHLLPHNRRLLP